MSVPQCLFFQDLEDLTEVFGRMSAGTSGQKLPLWADFSFLTFSVVLKQSWGLARFWCTQVWSWRSSSPASSPQRHVGRWSRHSLMCASPPGTRGVASHSSGRCFYAPCTLGWSRMSERRTSGSSRPSLRVQVLAVFSFISLGKSQFKCNVWENIWKSQTPFFQTSAAFWYTETGKTYHRRGGGSKTVFGEGFYGMFSLSWGLPPPLVFLWTTGCTPRGIPKPRVYQEDVNGEKLTVKKWWIFGADFSRFGADFFRFIRDINGEKETSRYWWSFSRLVFHGLPPLEFRNTRSFSPYVIQVPFRPLIFLSLPFWISML